MSLSFTITCIIGMITFNTALARNDVPLQSADTLFYLGGRVITVSIINITASTIRYTNEGEAEIREVDRKQIEKIVYRTGRVEVLNRPAFEMISEDDWRHVLVTDDPDEVAWLYERGKVEVTAAAVRNRRTTLRNAEVRLKRQAVSLGANMILVTDTEFKGGYGDVPSVTMRGIAYGFNPASEE